MENKHKIGFVKSVTGVMNTTKQTKELEAFGCTVHDNLQSALNDITRGDEVLCVVSPAVLGYKIPEIMNQLCKKKATLYSLISEKEYDGCLVSDVVEARNELSQRKKAYLANRTGKAKGGRPPKLTSEDKQRVRDLANDGKSYDKIEGLFDISASTISRIVNEDLK